ncbi:MAG: signal recognition particle receptor subunit alpha, partial [Cyanobacteria bacterium P01_H01_bin.105]
MSSFNWFRRGYDESSKKETAETVETDKSTIDTSSAETDSAENEAPANAEDYLAWAKAAYQNIQQQQTETEAAEATEPESAGPKADEPELDGPKSEETPQIEDPVSDEELVEAQAEILPAETLVAPETSATTETATDEILAPAAETSPPPETLDPATDAEDTPQQSASVAAPFWAKAAEAEREARLAKLRETAIVEPDPEPTSAPEPEPELVMPDVDLDEAFLWSAEVLASQGRRPDDISLEEITWLNQLRQGLGKTRRGLVNQLKAVVGQGPLNEDAIYEIEALLLQADVGVEATDKIIESLQARMREETLPPDAAIRYLKNLLRQMLDSPLDGDHN